MSETSKVVVGWGASNAVWAKPEAPSVSRAIAQSLYDAGVREAFGLLGGGIAPFSAGLSNTPIRFFHFRHEAGAGFAALESWFETGRPGVAVVTTGPGIFNVLNAAMAARVDGAKYLLISGFTSRPQVGRGAVQETSLASMPSDLTRPGSIFHDVAIPETVDELTNVLATIRRGFQRDGGFVFHLGLPQSLQTQLMPAPLQAPAAWKISRPAPDVETLDACLRQLADGPSVLWLGHGARHASDSLVRFAERANLPVITSPRAKGVFPESHPQFVGVSGAGGTPRVREFFATRKPKHALVVGSRLGEVTSFLAPGHCPSAGWIHVDTDASAFGAAFPQVPGLGVVADAAAFSSALLARAEATGWFKTLPAWQPLEVQEVETLAPRAEASLRPPFVMQRLQRAVVNRSDALVMSESGTSFTWCNAHLRFDTHGRYRTAAAWGSMGHFTTGCVGAALAGRRRVVAVVGDGAMLMNNEINTAVQYGANVVWVVMNDAQFGLNRHGMTAVGMRPVETQMPRTDFVAFARSQGADGVAVRFERDLDAALEQAMSTNAPFIIDLDIDPTVVSPVVADRVNSLKRQGGGAK